MSNREFKFRVWDGTDYMTEPFTLEEIMAGEVQWASNCVVMQFTGLSDKNGTEIFEGDTVKFHDHPTGIEDGIGKVYWKDGMWRITWSMIPLGDFGTMWLELLGNEFQHPELLTNSLT